MTSSPTLWCQSQGVVEESVVQEKPGELRKPCAHLSHSRFSHRCQTQLTLKHTNYLTITFGGGFIITNQKQILHLEYMIGYDVSDYYNLVISMEMKHELKSVIIPSWKSSWIVTKVHEIWWKNAPIIHEISWNFTKNHEKPSKLISRFFCESSQTMVVTICPYPSYLTKTRESSRFNSLGKWSRSNKGLCYSMYSMEMCVHYQPYSASDCEPMNVVGACNLVQWIHLHYGSWEALSVCGDVVWRLPCKLCQSGGTSSTLAPKDTIHLLDPVNISWYKLNALLVSSV